MWEKFAHGVTLMAYWLQTPHGSVRSLGNAISRLPSLVNKSTAIRNLYRSRKSVTGKYVVDNFNMNYESY